MKSSELRAKSLRRAKKNENNKCVYVICMYMYIYIYIYTHTRVQARPLRGWSDDNSRALAAGGLSLVSRRVIACTLGVLLAD